MKYLIQLIFEIVAATYNQHLTLTVYEPREGRGDDLAPPVRFFSVAPEVVMEGL